MELIIIIGNLLLGAIIAFVGFKTINPLYNASEEKQADFYRKWGLYLKAGGIAIAAVGFLRLFFML
jgi:hypothetical protein